MHGCESESIGMAPLAMHLYTYATVDIASTHYHNAIRMGRENAHDVQLAVKLCMCPGGTFLPIGSGRLVRDVSVSVHAVNESVFFWELRNLILRFSASHPQ